ncbi:acyltransferase [Herbaspirillum sp. HC18]|nr:acyltransferase [Herbaspirillum sp. HC18]
MAPTHFRILDLLKAIASNLIVLHHLAYYGPMSDHVRPLIPELAGWFEQHARVAVHAFLVMGGFLAAKSLSHMAVADPLRAVWRRFAKLVPSFMVAVVIAVAASALASQWMTHDSISAPPSPTQLIAHALLLHNVLGFESLSAGAWYVAIDFQLFALLTLMLWLAGRGVSSRWIAAVLVTAGAAASLMVFNLDPEWDVWAPYFFGSYGLGALAWWASDHKRGALGAAVFSGIILLLGGLSLELEFRSRIAVAFGTAMLLVLVCRGIVSLPGQRSKLAAFLGQISYGVFLVHFPVCLVVNATFTRFAPAEPEVQALGILLAWIASLAAGAGFHRWIEQPLSSLVDSSRRAERPQDAQPTS